MTEKKKQKTEKEHQVVFLPFDVKIGVPAGTTVLEAANQAYIPLKTTCGGKGTCGECVVQIISGSYKKKTSASLPYHLASQGYALACQTEIENDLSVRLPQFRELHIKSIIDSKFFDEQKDKISGIYEIDPLIKSVKLKLPSPTLEDNYSDLKRLSKELQKKLWLENLHVEYSVLRRLAQIVREKQGHINVVLFNPGGYPTVIDICSTPEDKRIYGIACDIGTSTVALHLVDLLNGKIIASGSSLNQQIKCGEDIISRIHYAQKPGRLEELQQLVILTVNNLIQKASLPVGISTSDIYYASFSGNTTMIHLLLNLDPQFIREEPYVPTFNHVPFILSRDLGLSMDHEARIHCSPAVGSYVGGDITAGLLCTPIIKDSDKISMFIDAGTNGELVVGNKDWLMTCACSAGPAFEGSGIKCGMPASEGAIERLRIEKNGQLDYQIINGFKPKGLCGSGLVDLLAELFINGFIDRYGKFNEQKTKDRLIETEEGLGFLIEEANRCFWGKDLVITERDLSNLIRTKGAVFSACSLLMKNVGLRSDKIDSFYIAGGFGQQLNIENAIRIGLLPDLDRDKFHYLGNSSLIGAYLVLISNKNKALLDEINGKMTYIELNTEPNYMNEYTGSLFLPHTDMKLFPSVNKIFNP